MDSRTVDKRDWKNCRIIKLLEFVLQHRTPSDMGYNEGLSKQKTVPE